MMTVEDGIQEAFRGFRMWLLYLRHCSDNDPLSFKYTEIKNTDVSGEEYKEEGRRILEKALGNIPCHPTGPLRAGIMGTYWAAYIKSVIASCTDKEATRKLFKLVEKGGKHENDVNYLFKALRKANCRKFASHASEDNQNTLLMHVNTHQDDTYCAFFVTNTNVEEDTGLISAMNFSMLREELLKYGCTYAMISICRQDIMHYHGLVIFAYPITIYGITTIFNIMTSRTGTNGWDISPCYSDVTYSISYIMQQEVDRMIYISLGDSQPNPIVVRDYYQSGIRSDKLCYTPMYMIQKLSLNDSEAKHVASTRKYFDGYAKNIQSRTIVRNKKQIAFLKDTFGRDAINYAYTLGLASEGDKSQRPIVCLASSYNTKNNLRRMLKSLPYIFVILDDEEQQREERSTNTAGERQ